MIKKIINIAKNMGSITFNGTTIIGDNISISKNNVNVDGKDYSFEYENMNVVVNGPVKSLDIKACRTVEVNGDCEDISTSSGDVKCKNVTSNVNTSSGDVEVEGNIGGNASTMSGDVEAGSITGNTKTMSGDITVK